MPFCICHALLGPSVTVWGVSRGRADTPGLMKREAQMKG